MESKTTITLEIKIHEPDIESFKSALKKISLPEVGFNKYGMTQAELDVLKKLSENVNKV